MKLLHRHRHLLQHHQHHRPRLPRSFQQLLLTVVLMVFKETQQIVAVLAVTTTAMALGLSTGHLAIS